jgi:hypothetical protein
LIQKIMGKNCSLTLEESRKILAKKLNARELIIV